MALAFKGVIFLDRNGFLLFSDSVNRVLQYNFPPTVVRDLEVINQELLDSQIAAFFKQSELKPFQAVILLSENLLFEKAFTSPQEEKDQSELTVFMDNLPFEHVGSIIYTSDGSKFIATNKELYQMISQSFEKQSCVVSVIIPAFVVNTDINLMAGMTDPGASDVFRRAMSLRQYSFLTDAPPKILPQNEDQKMMESEKKEEHITDSFAPSDMKEKKGESKSGRLFLLIGVFVILMIILGVVAFTML